MATDYDLKKSLPNKMVNENNTITDLTGNPVTNAVIEYENKQALPNKWLNPDGTYSTLAEILSSMIDTDLFIVVEELPASGNVNKIYLLTVDDKLEEYHWTGTKWDPIGMVEFDLSKYSTTEQMNEAIMATLNSAKAYTDEQIAGISVDPQVFYWDGDTQQTGLDFWNNIVEVNKKSDVIINGESIMGGTVTHNVFAIIEKGHLYNNLVKYGEASTLFSYQMDVGHQNSYSVLRDNASQVKLSDSNKEGIVKNVTHTTSAFTYNRATYLATNRNYSTPYEPQYPGSPATKKYVDDSIATNITNVLGGSY